MPSVEETSVREAVPEAPSTSEGLEEHHLDLLHSIDEAFDEVEIEEEIIEEPVKPTRNELSAATAKTVRLFTTFFIF